MADLQPYIARAMCVVSFSQDKEIRYKVKEVERAFRNVLSSEAASTNVSDSMPPPIPRLTLEAGPKQIAISQVSAQLELSFDEKKRTLIKETYEVIAKNSLEFWDGACQLKQPNERKDMGIVLTIHCPSTLTREQVAQTIHEKYTKVPTFGKPVTTQVQCGFLVPELEIFCNVALGSYQIRKGAIKGHSGEVVTVDLEALEISESGFDIKMDVNTKPMAKDGREIPETVGRLVVDELRRLVFESGSQFLAW